MGLRRSFNPANIAKNGNFSNVSNWAVSRANWAAINNVAVMTGDGVSGNIAILQDSSTPSVSGKRVYIRAIVLVDNVKCVEIIPYIHDSNLHTAVFSSTKISTPTENTWYATSGVISQNADNTGYVRVAINYKYAIATDALNTVNKCREFIAVDISSLPNEVQVLSIADQKSWCDANIPVWFDGTMSGGKIGGIGGLK